MGAIAKNLRSVLVFSNGISSKRLRHAVRCVGAEKANNRSVWSLSFQVGWDWGGSLKVATTRYRSIKYC